MEENKPKNEVMLAETAEGARDFAQRVAQVTTAEEQTALLGWMKDLLAVRSGKESEITKAIQALKLTANSKTLWPVLKVLGAEAKHYGWDDRSLKARFGIVGAAAGVVVFGWAGAGIAALGGAIGLPLWIVLGAGGLAAGAIVEELTVKKPPPK
jgi:hypothetical protein